MKASQVSTSSFTNCAYNTIPISMRFLRVHVSSLSLTYSVFGVHRA